MSQAPTDQPVPLQQDNVQPVQGTGAGIRTILVTVVGPGNVPMQVAMQCIAVSDAEGHTIDFANQPMVDLLKLLLAEQQATNQMLSVLSNVPYNVTPYLTVDPAGNTVTD